MVRKSKKISIVWIIPIVALVLGAWLLYRHKSDEGPLIEVTFDDASGLEVGKTKVKFREVELGDVADIRLSPDVSSVIVSVRMSKDTLPYLNDSAKFWVVKPRVGAGAITGLSTLVSGAYIALDAQAGGSGERQFVGLDAPPPRSQSASGTKVVLETDRTFSLTKGSPVYYRQLDVGEIDSVELEEDFSTVRIEAFVEAPYDELIHAGTQFWNVSGLTAELDTEGISLQVQSLESLILGGIAFDSPPLGAADSAVGTDHVFMLFENRDAPNEKQYTSKRYYVLNFEDSIRGLKEGALVSYRGLELGRVSAIDTHLDESGKLFIPVTIEIEPERLGIEQPDLNETEQRAQIEQLIADGLRARLQMGNLLTGQLFVNLDFYPDAEPVSAQVFQGLPEIPTLSTDIEDITRNVGDVVAKINNLDIETLVSDANQTILDMQKLVRDIDLRLAGVLENLDQTMTDSRQLVGSIDGKVVEVMESLNQTLRESRVLIEGLDEGSVTRHQLNEMLQEIQQAARSMRRLTESIEKDPNSLIFGKQGRSNN